MPRSIVLPASDPMSSRYLRARREVHRSTRSAWSRCSQVHSRSPKSISPSNWDAWPSGRRCIRPGAHRAGRVDPSPQAHSIGCVAIVSDELRQTVRSFRYRSSAMARDAEMHSSCGQLSSVHAKGAQPRRAAPKRMRPTAESDESLELSTDQRSSAGSVLPYPPLSSPASSRSAISRSFSARHSA